MLVILFAQSRAAWAALIVGLICLLLAIGAQRVGACRLCRSRWLRVVAALVVFGLVVSLIVLGVLGANGLLERNVDVPGRDNPVIMDGDVWLRFGDWLVQRGWMTRPATMSWAARVEVWSRALWASAEFPLTGLGMDMFRRSAWEMYPFFQMAYGQDFGHAHNILLQVALDLGLPGLISYLALLVGLLVAGWWSYRSSTNQFTRLITLGGIVGLATHALWSFVDALPLGARTNVHWWAMAALLATTSNLVLSKGVADSAKAGAEATSVAASRT
jgi:O-antigen ligase